MIESTNESGNEDVFQPFAASTPAKVKINSRSVYDLYDEESDAASSVETPVKSRHTDESYRVDLHDTDSDSEFTGSPVSSGSTQVESQTVQLCKDQIWIHLDDDRTSTEHVVTYGTSQCKNVEEQHPNSLQLNGKLTILSLNPKIIKCNSFPVGPLNMEKSYSIHWGWLRYQPRYEIC